MGFVKVTQRCIGCKATLSDSGGALCRNCLPREAEVYIGKLQQLQQCERLFWQIFTAAQREWECCPKAPVFVDFRGSAIAEHVANRTWEMGKWVHGLRKAKGASPREVFWRVWGLTTFLSCACCGEQFPLSELEHCAYHPQAPHPSPAPTPSLKTNPARPQPSHWP